MEEEAGDRREQDPELEELIGDPRIKKSRQELEIYNQDLLAMAGPLYLALDKEAPTPMTLLQARTVNCALDTLKMRMSNAEFVLVRNEVKPDLIASDAETRRKSNKQWEKIKEMAISLQTMYKAEKQVTTLSRDLRGMEQKKEREPDLDFTKSMTLVDTQFSELKANLEHTDLPSDHELWIRYEELGDRRLAILCNKITPPETKEFPRMFSKNPYKITDLVVPKFNGKIEQWIPFWEEFEHAVNSKTDMNECTKLVYLKQAILDPGLKSTIADLGIKDKAYPTAIKLLQDRFNKPRIIHRQCCEAIKSIPTNNNSRASLTEMADKVQHILTGLTRLESLGASEILTSMAEMAMNKELKHQWLTHTSKSTTTPPVEEVIAFIKERADQAEGEESTVPVKPSLEKSRNNKPAHHKNRGSSHAASAPPAITPAVVPAAAPAFAPQQVRGASQAAKTEYLPVGTPVHFAQKIIIRITAIFSRLIHQLKEKNMCKHILCASTALKQGMLQQIVGQPIDVKPAEHNIILFSMKINLVFLTLPWVQQMQLNLMQHLL